MLKRGLILVLLSVFAAVAAAGPVAALLAGTGTPSAGAAVKPAPCGDCGDCDSTMGACPASCSAICKLPVPAPASAASLQVPATKTLRSEAAAAPAGRFVLPDPRPPRAI